MKNTMKRNAIATMIGATALFATAFSANAATITAENQKFTMETPDDSWKEIEDQTSAMTLTNGKDYVTVTCFDKSEAEKDMSLLPKITLAHDEFQEEYLTYYSTKTDVFVITGLSAEEAGIEDVRTIANSIKLADHKYKSDDNKKVQDHKKEDDKKDEKGDEIAKTDEMYTLYNEVGNSVIVYMYSDGNYRSEDGTLFQLTDDGRWIDYYGNHYNTTGASESATQTGLSYDLTDPNGGLHVVYEYSDGTFRSEDGTLFQDVDGNHFVDYFGNHYYKDSMPQDDNNGSVQTYYLTDENGNLRIVYEDSEGNLSADDGTPFQNVDGYEFVDYYGNHYYNN